MRVRIGPSTTLYASASMGAYVCTAFKDPYPVTWETAKILLGLAAMGLGADVTNIATKVARGA